MELHLQEGFTGQRVVIAVNGAVVAEIASATTKLMLGLAEIVQLDVTPGQEVWIRVEGDDGAEQSFTAKDTQEFVTVTRVDGGLVLGFPAQSPGYV